MSVLPAANTTRLTSLMIAVAVGVGGWLLTMVTGTVPPVAAGGLAGGLLGITTLFCNTDHPVGTATATLLLPVAAIALVGALGLSVREVVLLVTEGESILRTLIGYPGTTLAVGLAAFGAVSTLDTGVGKGAVARLWQTAVMALFGISIVLGSLLVVQFEALTAVSLPGVDGSLLSVFVFQPSEPSFVVITFWLLSCLFVGTLKLLIAVAPVVELTPQTKQERVTRLLSRTHSVLNLVFGLMACLTLVAVALTVWSTDFGELLAPYPGLYALFAATGLRQLLVGGTVLLVLATAMLGGLQFATGRVTDTVGRLVPSLLGGATSLGLAAIGSPVVPGLLERVPDTPLPVGQIATALTPPGVVMTVIALSMALVTGLLTVLVVAGALTYIPSRTAGSAIASGSLGGGAIAAGIYGAESLVVFALVASSVLVWDLGERSVTTRAELGGLRSVQLESIHMFSTLGLAVAGVGLAWGLYTNVLGRLVVSGGTLVGMLASALGVLFVVVALRG